MSAYDPRFLATPGALPALAPTYRPVRRPRSSVELTQDHAVAILGDLQLLSVRFGREDKDLEGRIASLREQIQAAFVEDRR